MDIFMIFQLIIIVMRLMIFLDINIYKKCMMKYNIQINLFRIVSPGEGGQSI